MANTSETTGAALTEMLRFRCPPELKKAIGHFAVDDGTTEQSILLRLLSAAVEKEEQRRRRAS